MNDIQLSKSLGWFSLGLGALELLASRRIATMVGVANRGVVLAFGAREVAAGLMVLSKPDTAMPIWSRVAGDAMDAVVLAKGLRLGNRRGGAAAAMLFVLGAAAIDVAVASALSRREEKALGTARRTRIQRGGMGQALTNGGIPSAPP